MIFSRNISKMMDPVQKEVGGHSFYVYPFPAFKAANISGEVTALVTPLLASVAAALGMGGIQNMMDMDMKEAAPHIAGAFSMLSGDKVEMLMRKLLLSENVGVHPEGSESAQWLTEELCNEVFCGNTQDMFILAFYVIKVNFSGFFESFGNLFGVVSRTAEKMGFPGMEPLT